MIPLSLLPYKIYGDRVVLDFLDPSKHSSYAEKVIDIVERHVDKFVNVDALKREIANIIGDRKVSGILFHVIKYFYEFSDPNISYIDDIMNFYKFVNKKYAGSIPLSKHSSVIEEYSRLIRRNFRDMLVESIFSLKRLNRSIRPTPIDLISLANFLIIEKALSLAIDLNITFYPEEKFGRILREITYRAKRFKALVDVEVSDGALICSIKNPWEYLPQETALHYGRKISRIISYSLYKFKPWELRAHLFLKGSTYLLKMRSQSPWIPPFKPPHLYMKKLGSPDELFDSAVEKTIYAIISELIRGKECKILREGDVIPLPGNKFFIPDLTILCGKEKLFIEIIGFWTRDYALRKKEKLITMVKMKLKNIILIVDEKLNEYFSDLPFSIIFYKYGELNKLKDALKSILSSRMREID